MDYGRETYDLHGSVKVSTVEWYVYVREGEYYFSTCLLHLYTIFSVYATVFSNLCNIYSILSPSILFRYVFCLSCLLHLLLCPPCLFCPLCLYTTSTNAFMISYRIDMHNYTRAMLQHSKASERINYKEHSG